MKKDNRKINKTLKVGLLFDKSNDWIYKYIRQSTILKIKNLDLKLSFNRHVFKNYDVIFVLGYTKILPKSFLLRNRLNLVCHESKLPKGRGFAPVQWQILQGLNKIPISLIKINDKPDEGEILLESFFKLEGNELLPEIREKQANATIKIIKRFLSQYPKFLLKPQKGKPSYFPRRKSSDSRLDINKSIKDQFNLLRICDNDKWPAFFYYKSKKYKIIIND